MLAPASLASLKLRNLLGSHREITTDQNWRWQERVWIYEGIGFTWFGSFAKSPRKTIAFELNFSELTFPEEETILAALQLQVRRSMTHADLVSALGQHSSEQRYVPDRVTLQFYAGPEMHYALDATVHEIKGLVHLSVIPRHLLPK